MSQQSLTVDGVVLSLRVERKRVKNINARLRDGALLVSAPPHVTQATLDQVIPALARRLLRRAHARAVNAEEDALALAHAVAARFEQPPAVAQVKFVANQEARWGSYSAATGTVRLNAVLEAVVAHELAHVFHYDHSPAFWALLRRVCPETDRAQAFLAGVSWLGTRWPDLPEVERALLARGGALEE